MPKIRFKRGLKANLPTLNEAEPGFTTDTEELFVGSKDGNVQFAKQSDINGKVNQSDLDTTNINVAANTSSLSDIATVNNHSISYGYDANGNVQTITEKDSDNNAVKTVTYTYNALGNVATSVTVMNGKTVTTTYNYDANANITSTTNVIS